MSEAACVFVVDDDDAVRDSLRVLLQSAGYSVEVFASAHALLESSRQTGACALIDVRMPEMDGLALQDELRRRKPEIPVIIMTGHADVPLAVRSMKAGALDFLEKPVNRFQLLASVEKALQSRGPARQSQIEHDAARQRIAELTERERDVFDLLVAGHQSKAIARKLNISPRTVQVHRGHVMHKLGVTSLQDLVRLAIAASEA